MRVDSFLRNGFFDGDNGAGPGDIGGAAGIPSRGEVFFFKSGDEVSIGGGGDGLAGEPIISI
jgi:hypothetical protein